MAKKKTPRRDVSLRTSIGGASNEVGSQFRASIAAWAAAHALVGRPLPLPGISGPAAVPSAIHLETSDDLDDVRVDFADRDHVQLQAKHSLNLAASSKPMQASIRQWRAALCNSALDVGKARLIVATARPSEAIRALASALQKQKGVHSGSPTKAEREALSRTQRMLAVSDEQFTKFCKMAAIVELPSATGVALDHLSIELLDGRVVGVGQGPAAWRALIDYARELARLRAGDTPTFR